MAKKFFVLDTNVLLHNPGALTSFADNEVVIPFTVIEELDKFKKGNNDIARHARQVIRTLDRLRQKGRIAEGVPLKEIGGSLRVVLDDTLADHPLLRQDKPDNRIISVAFKLLGEGKPTTFVSKDINARIKSDALGIRTMDFEKQKVDFEHIYTGYREVEVEGRLLDAFGREKGMALQWDDLVPNEFVILQDAANKERRDIARFDVKQKRLLPLKYGRRTIQGVKARNPQQEMVMELLMLEDVQLVTLLGSAGTGKTLLALACGLQSVISENSFEKLLISRPVLPFGQDIGYLPGTKEEKLANWMLPIYDNLAYILRARKGDKSGGLNKQINELLESKMIEMEALTYMRGRSIPEQYIIVDEAQNLTPHEVKTVVSRIGEGSKLVMTGDPYQIDNPYLDSSSNGLSYSAERMKGLDMVGTVMLKRSERSRLASLAAERL